MYADFVSWSVLYILVKIYKVIMSKIKAIIHNEIIVYLIIYLFIFIYFFIFLAI